MLNIIPDELGEDWVRLEHHYPSMAAIVMEVPLPFVMVDDPQFTLCCTPTEIRVGRQWLAANTANVRVSGLLHELVHWIFGDCHWLKSVSEAGMVGKHPFVPEIAQWAMDFRNNSCLVNFGAELGPGWLHDEKIGTFTDAIEVIYDRLMQRQPPPPPSPSAGGDVEPGEPSDGDGMPADGESELDQMRRGQLAERAISETCAAKGVGAGNMKTLVKRVNPTRIKWTQLIKPTLTSMLGRGAISWARPNVYTLPMKFILPGPIGKKSGFLAVVRDTSGSVSDQELAIAYSGLREILHYCQPSKLLAIDCDWVVQATHWLAGPGALKPEVCEIAEGRGGTHMPHALDWLKENDHAPDVVVFITDMETGFPDDMSPAKEVIWINVRKNGIEAPACAGQTVFLP